MTNIAIRVDNLSKQYQIGMANFRHNTLRDQIMAAVTSVFWRDGWLAINAQRPALTDTIWALKNVSFEVKQGEVLGIVGRNGAGKSTLLKILSRITEPTAGYAEVYGRMGSLLEVGTGFHGELTGRENMYLNGAILGMKKAEVNRKFDEIVDFSGVEKFIDTPVKRYSSGMYVRLAFAVAAHLETEILIADEVLAVGDSEFQKKCLGKMGDLAKEGRTVVLVSHNMATILNLCPRAILLRVGHLVDDGAAEDVVGAYLAHLTSSVAQEFDDNPEREGNGLVRLTGARILDESNQPSSHLVGGRRASIEFSYENVAHEDRANVIFTIFNQLGVAVSHFDYELTGHLVKDLGTNGKFICNIPDLPLPIGQYRIAVVVQLFGEIADSIPNALVFDVESSVFFHTNRTPPLRYCTCMIRHSWRHEVAGSTD